MNSNELFEQFKSSTNGYQLTPLGIIFEKEKNILKIYKPQQSETSDCLLYDLIVEGRMTSSTDNIDELIELSIEVMGYDTRKKDISTNSQSSTHSSDSKSPYQYYY